MTIAVSERLRLKIAFLQFEFEQRDEEEAAAAPAEAEEVDDNGGFEPYLMEVEQNSWLQKYEL